MAFTETITSVASIFTPPAGCKSHWTFEGSYYNSIPGGYLGQNVLTESLDSSCFPKGFEGFGRVPSDIQVYSPGWCPSGYTSAVVGNGDTTTVTCCQSGFTYHTEYSSVNFGEGSSTLFAGCISKFVGTTSVKARVNNTDLSSSQVSGSITMWGQPIYIEFRSKDVSLFTTTTSSSTSSTDTSSSTSTPTSTNTSTSTASAAPGSQDVTTGLSSGAKAGIGVAVALGLLAAIALGFFLIMRRRKQRMTSQTPMADPLPLKYESGPNQMWERGELDGNTNHPHSGWDQPLELPSHDVQNKGRYHPLPPAELE